MVRLQHVEREDRELLWNINQKYMYEMTQYYPEAMDERGNYSYEYFDMYFTDPARGAYFIFDDETMVGFVMLHPYSCLDHCPDHTIAEFTIFPAYRRNHYALDSAKRILSEYPGKWEIKYNERNLGAKQLWTAVAAPYSPEVYHLNEEETVLEFEN